MYIDFVNLSECVKNVCRTFQMLPFSNDTKLYHTSNCLRSIANSNCLETPEEPVPKPKRKRAVRDVEEEQELITIEQLQQALQLTEVRAEAITLREEMPRAIQVLFS